MFKKGDIVNFYGNRAKIIGIARKSGKIVYKLRYCDIKDVIAYNVDYTQIEKYVEK